MDSQRLAELYQRSISGSELQQWWAGARVTILAHELAELGCPRLAERVRRGQWDAQSPEWLELDGEARGDYEDLARQMCGLAPDTHPHLRYLALAVSLIQSEVYPNLWSPGWKTMANARAALRWADTRPYQYGPPPGYRPSTPGHLPVEQALRYLEVWCRG